MSDRISGVRGGAYPGRSAVRTIYDTPANAFVAGFVGENNMLAGMVVTRRAINALSGCPAARSSAQWRPAKSWPEAPVIAAIRPEHVETGANPPACCNAIEARVEELAYHGDHSRIRAGTRWRRIARDPDGGCAGDCARTADSDRLVHRSLFRLPAEDRAAVHRKRGRMKAWARLLGVAALTASVAACGSSSELRPLTVVGWGGSSQDAHRKAY